MMEKRVLILGGYGNFGKRIAKGLVKLEKTVVVAGRNARKLDATVAELGLRCSSAQFDAKKELANQLAQIKPFVVINCCGPFQGADYNIARTCIQKGCHYIDLSDGREFVKGFTELDRAAKSANVELVTGASTVPSLSSAVLEHFKKDFSEMTSLRYGISPGQKTLRGVATTKAILGYCGKPIPAFAGNKDAYGWLDLHRQAYPEIGKRWMGNCEIPDLDILSARYGLKSIQFSAGMELAPVHLGLWALSHLVKMGLPLNLPAWASCLLKLCRFLDPFGSDIGGMHMVLSGLDRKGKPLTKTWYVLGKDGHGPEIPTVPAILLAKDWLEGENLQTGARAAVARIGLDRYFAQLHEFSIQTFEY